MARIPNIKVVIPDGDSSMAIVTDADTGERIDNIVSLKIDLDANRKPFVMVEMKVFTGLEYEGPVTEVVEAEPDRTSDELKEWARGSLLPYLAREIRERREGGA